MAERHEVDGPDPFIPAAEAARLLGVSERTIRRYADEGLLVAEKTLGGRRRLRLSVVQAAVEHAASQPTARVA